MQRAVGGNDELDCVADGGIERGDALSKSSAPVIFRYLLMRLFDDTHRVILPDSTLMMTVRSEGG